MRRGLRRPKLVYADAEGHVFDHPVLDAAGRTGDQIVLPSREEWIPLPPGSRLFTMPGRMPVGFDPLRSEFVALEGTLAVAAFPEPGYTRTLLPATQTETKPPILPLWAYTAVGWHNGQFWIPAIHVDDNPRWNPIHYDDREVVPAVRAKLKAFPHNLVWDQLARCAIDYHCFAAKNAFLGRWELPMPTSPVCNAACIGCLSFQPEGSCPASHERVLEVPTPEEIAEVAVPHLETAAFPLLSFGQGCEGDPLLQAPVIERAIRLIRERTSRGTVNINTNASKPHLVERLAKAGLDSIRISLNSALPETYARYYRPRGYAFHDVLESARVAKEYGLHVALNYLMFPGVNDRPSEVEALCEFLHKTGVDQIQMRNLSIDPDLYWNALGLSPEPAIGFRAWMRLIRQNFPNIAFGYYNRPVRGEENSHAL